MLLACGSNGNGQLGLGHEEDRKSWTLVPISLSGPIRIAGGGNHTVIVEQQTGRAYISDKTGFVAIAHPQGQKWRLCAAGWAFTVLVDEESRVWVSGSGPKGELGLGAETNAPLTRIEWVPPASIVSVKSGMSHTVVCLSNGSLWGWGASRKGQLNCTTAVVDRPLLVMSEPSLTKDSYACGRDFTAVLAAGQLSILGNTRWFASNRIDVANDTTVLAGWSSVLLLPSGRALGNNSHGQLDAPSMPRSVALGSEHGLCYIDGVVRTWGWGEHGNCPPDGEFPQNVALFAGCATSFVYCT